MNSTVKTIILAAAGAALIIASPALAKSKHPTASQNNVPAATQLYQEGAIAPSPGAYVSGDTFGQILATSI